MKDDKIENYYDRSHKLGIVPKNLNKLKDKLFGIECNFEELNGIDFKGFMWAREYCKNKLKNKLSKRLLPIKMVSGEVAEDEKIYINDVEIGKVLIDDNYPFALIKILDKNFDKSKTFKTDNGVFKIIVPEWIKF